jgi:hypothetical protein
MSIQTTFQHLVYLFWINICFNHVLEILFIYPTLEMMNDCYVKTLQEPSAYLCALCLFEFVGIFWDKSLKLNFVRSKCLWPNVDCWLVWYGATMLIYFISKHGEISDNFFENKTRQVPQWSYYLPKPYVDINVQTFYTCLLVTHLVLPNCCHAW